MARRLLWLLPALLSASGAGYGQTDTRQDKREELIIQGKRNRPLSEWEQMQAHDVQYQQLKAKFDPDMRQTTIDQGAADRDFAAPGGIHALQQEREAPVVVDPQSSP
jgi:hypothetical protein